MSFAIIYWANTWADKQTIYHGPVFQTVLKISDQFYIHEE